MRLLNEVGLDLLKHLEGCKLQSYSDTGGVLTIGYGHTGVDVHPNQVITQDQALELLKRDLEKFCSGVERITKGAYLNDNQFAALVCFAYNIGLQAFGMSSVCHKINSGDLSDLNTYWMKWNKVHGVPVLGLTRRREQEYALWCKPINQEKSTG